MRKLLYTLGCVLSALAIFFLLLPFFMGVLSENRCKHVVSVINSTSPFSVKVVEYRRHWFSSEAVIQLSLDDLVSSNKELFQFNVKAHVKHGPVFIDWIRFRFAQAIIDADVYLNSVQNVLLNRSFDAPPFANIKIKFRLSGKAYVDFVSVPISYQGQKSNVNWQGLRIKSKFSPLYNRTESKIAFSGFDIGLIDYNFHLGKISSFYQGSKLNDDLWLGERLVQVDSFAIKNPKNRIVSLGGLNLRSVITESENNHVNISTALSVDNLNVNGAIYSRNKLDFEFRDISKAGFIELKRQLMDDLGGLTFNRDTALNMMSRFFVDGGKINVKRFNTDTPWGKSFADMEISFFGQGSKNVGFLSEILNSSMTLNFKADRKLMLHLMEKFYQVSPLVKKQDDPIEKASQLLGKWERSGKLVVSDKDNYFHILLEYNGGKILINGKQLTFTTIP